MPQGEGSRPRSGAKRSDPHTPLPGSGSGFTGRRFERTGTEPVTARSALSLRLLLSICYTPLFIAASVLFAVWATRSRPGSSPTSSQLTVLAGACAVLAVISAVDMAVILRRRRNERLPHRTAR
ncbi:DUF6343 family protein [Streptomyces scabiei]|uniref:DUF6343 family protein n=1 Tax=Streptomyces niveiscabiei TaxID=164115 RepID=A0ABW9HXS2_9ACTN|nr:DUF6343 family protein [Streptomyces europaeiscabiei]MDX3866531.1 DUF6343 family protein [Streptomyces europaeiscabiei]MDX3874526.1 DUF6343 family protein [Streptomyces europaeiscabiei]WSZ18963.1 DUF368 domain-containing protein [Streptomyces canus]